MEEEGISRRKRALVNKTLVLKWVPVGPWELLGLILELLGSILGCLGHPKLAQSAPGWHLADIVETYENCRVFKGLRGWRLPSRH